MGLFEGLRGRRGGGQGGPPPQRRDYQDVVGRSFRRPDAAGSAGPFSLDVGADADKARIRDAWLAR
jgi:hypothetical protein